MRRGASNDATGRQQQLGLMVGTVAECGGCRLALMAASAQSSERDGNRLRTSRRRDRRGVVAIQ